MASEANNPALPVMTLCDSKMIHSYGYNPETKQLFVRFVHGRKLYRYDDFPADMHKTMREAVSAGKYFSQHVVKQYHGIYIKEND